MRTISALDAMRSRLRPARPKNRTRLELLSARMEPKVARVFLEDEDVIDAILMQCEQKFIPIDLDDLAAVFLIRRGQEAYDLSLNLITCFNDGARANTPLPVDLDRAIRLGRSSLGLPPHDRHL